MLVSLSFGEKFLSMGLFITIAIWKIFARQILAGAYLNMRNGNNLPQPTKIKFSFSLFKCLYGISAVLVGVIVLHGESWIFKCDSYADGAMFIPFKLRFYYIYEMCFYTNELLTIFIEPKKKDRAQMFLHHVTTLVLMALSFNTKYFKYGCVIMLLHDITDPFLEAAKTENYLKSQINADVLFFIFMAAFVILRLFIFPRYLIWTAIKHHRSEFLKKKGISIILVSLVVMQIMHIIWATYIFRVLFKILNGEKVGDVREGK